MDNIDTQLKNIQPPPGLLALVTLDHHLTVKDLLAFPLVHQPVDKILWKIPSSSWFNTLPANNMPKLLAECVLPSSLLCVNLEDHLRVALKNGCLSVHHPTDPNFRLLIWAVRFLE